MLVDHQLSCEPSLEHSPLTRDSPGLLAVTCTERHTSLRAPRLPIAEKYRWLLAGVDEAFGAGTYLDAAPPAPS